MDFTSTIVPLISNAYVELFKQATVLEHMLDYQVCETCRSPKEMLIECVALPTFAAKTITSLALPTIDESTWEYEEFVSLKECHSNWERVKPDLFLAIKSFPQEKLLEEIQSPWGTFPWRDFIAYCYWNPMWHAGQMAYIQMIHGDEKMH